MRKRMIAAGAAALALGGVLIGTTTAVAAPVAAPRSAATSCPSNGGDSINFTNKHYEHTSTNGPLTIHLESGTNPANGRQYAWTFVQNASKNDQAWLDYTTGSGYIQCGNIYSAGNDSFYTAAYLTSASTSVHMKGCAEDLSAGETVCTAAW
jgi:hypothetical protein